MSEYYDGFLVRDKRKQTRYYIDNELLEKYASILRPHGIAVYNCLAKFANSKTQTCYPSYETILKQTGIGRRNTVLKYLRLLVRCKIIAVKRFKGRSPNVYYLLDHTQWTDLSSIQMDTAKVISKKDAQQYPLVRGSSISMATESQRSKSLDEIKRDKSKILTETRQQLEAMGIFRKKDRN